jgi:hypothetical protein
MKKARDGIHRSDACGVLNCCNRQCCRDATCYQNTRYDIFVRMRAADGNRGENGRWLIRRWIAVADSVDLTLRNCPDRGVFASVARPHEVRVSLPNHTLRTSLCRLPPRPR